MCGRNRQSENGMKSDATDLIHIYLRPGELHVAERPTIVTTVLGSCISVTMFNLEHRMGAICHAQLPEENESGRALRYVDSSILMMLESLAWYGIRPDELEVKLFGGADILRPGMSRRSGFRVGSKNIEAALRVIHAERLTLVASDVGGNEGRKILFNTHTGEILLKRLPRVKELC